MFLSSPSFIFAPKFKRRRIMEGISELSLDNILSGEELNALFPDDGEAEAGEKKADAGKPGKKAEKAEEAESGDDGSKQIAEDVKSEDLFDGSPESVGDQKDKGKEDTASVKGGESPNFYSSIANALVEDGIFQDLNEEDVKGIRSAEDFADAITKEVEAKLNDKQKAIDEALGIGIEPSQIQKYMSLKQYFDSIGDAELSEEGDRGEALRKRLIYQDYINMGFTEERAKKEVERSLNAGTDIDDAKEALQSNKAYLQKVFDQMKADAAKADEIRKKAEKEEYDKLRGSILDDEDAFGGLKVDKRTRQKAFDAIMKPVYQDPDDPKNKLTELQKYQRDNKLNFIKNIGLVYVLTDGFKNLDGLVADGVRKGMRKGLRELEHTINNTSRSTDGSLNFMSGVGDPDSKSTKWDIDI